MSASSGVNVAEAIARLRAFSEELFVKTTTNAIRRAMSAGRKTAADRLAKAAIGIAVARRSRVLRQQAKGLGLSGAPLSGLSKSGIPLIVKRGKLEMKNDFGSGQRSWSGSIQTMGFAALIEMGGRTKPHQIKAIRLGGYSRRRSVRARQVAEGARLLFPVGGRWVSPKLVTHPGSRVPRNPFMEEGGRRAEAVLGDELEKGLAQAIEKAGL